MKYLFAIVACLALAGTAQAQSYGVKYDAQAFAINLPQDQHKPYVTVIGDPADARYNAIRNWFDANPNLAGLKATAHYTELPTTSAMYRDRYASSCPQTPCVRVQAADGTVLTEYAGHEIPMSAEALTRGIGSCFRSTPTPADTPAPPPPVPAKHEPWLILTVIAFVVGLVAGIVQSFRQSTTPKKGTSK